MMTRMNVNGTVGKAIANYLGLDASTEAVSTLLCHPDPVVAGTYAFRATVKGRHFDFLTIGVPLGKVTDEDLEECDWAEWPPKSEGRPTSWVVR